MNFTEIALSLFFTMNAIGNMPLIIAILSQYETKKQLFIIFREMIIGLVILLLFGFFGLSILDFLKIDQSVIGVAGGIILFLLALNMLFPKPKSTEVPHHEPFIVPIATPIIVGPGTMAMMAVFLHQVDSRFVVISAGLSAWLATTLILLASSFVKKILPPNVLLATERLMGLILTFIAIQMILSSLIKYLVK